MIKVRPFLISLFGVTDWHVVARGSGYRWERYCPRKHTWELRDIDSPEIISANLREALEQIPEGVSVTFAFEDEKQLLSSEWFRFAKRHKLISASIGSWQDDSTSVSVTERGRAALGYPRDDDWYTRLSFWLDAARCIFINRLATQ